MVLFEFNLSARVPFSPLSQKITPVIALLSRIDLGSCLQNIARVMLLQPGPVCHFYVTDIKEEVHTLHLLAKDKT